MTNVKNIDEYIRGFPKDIQNTLKKMRQVIRAAAPEAGEAIKYGMPTFTLHGNLVHFAAMKNHIGLYPTPRPIAAFKKELAKYETTKGAIRFPLDEPIPFGLVKKIVRFRVKETLAKS